MKVIILILTATFFENVAISQWHLKPSLEVSYNYSFFGSYDRYRLASIIGGNDFNTRYYRSNTPYQIFCLKGGIAFQKKRYSLEFKGTFQHLICKGEQIMKSNFIGISITNRFRENKIVRPLIIVELSTEINTNYVDDYLDERFYSPIKFSSPSSLPWYFNVNLYKSTPFIGNLLMGCNFKLYKGLSMNVVLGYGIRVIKLQYAHLEYVYNSAEIPDKIHTINKPYTLGFNMFVVQTGLNYTFSFKKKDKITTKN